MDDRTTPPHSPEEREKSQADTRSTLGDRLRHEASLAREDYLYELIRLGRTNDENDHQDLEMARLQYLRLLEAASWADGPDEDHLGFF